MGNGGLEINVAEYEIMEGEELNMPRITSLSAYGGIKPEDPAQNNVLCTR